MKEPVCSYCKGIRLVGWSGAGPILCHQCSRGEDAFTVITQAWREQRAEVSNVLDVAEGLRAENAKLRAELTAARDRLAHVLSHVRQALKVSGE